MKRTRGESLTGGSGDVNPQIMVVKAVQSGNDVTGATAQAMPIPRLPTRKGKSLVIELLQIEFVIPTQPTLTATNVTMMVLSTNPTTPTTTIAAAEDPRTLALWINWTAIAAAGTINLDRSRVLDTTDDAGHGLLIATDQIYLYMLSGFTGIANTGIARLLYRFKEVSLEEYIGIVQSQQ